MFPRKDNLIKATNDYELLKEIFDKLGKLKVIQEEKKNNENSLKKMTKFISIIENSSKENEELFIKLESKNSNLEKAIVFSRKLTEIISELKVLSDKIEL